MWVGDETAGAQHEKCSEKRYGMIPQTVEATNYEYCQKCRGAMTKQGSVVRKALVIKGFAPVPFFMGNPLTYVSPSCVYKICRCLSFNYFLHNFLVSFEATLILFFLPLLCRLLRRSSISTSFFSFLFVSYIFFLFFTHFWCCS